MDPALFSLAMVFIVEHVSRKVGFSVGNTRITDLDYAYDVFLFAERSEFPDVLKVTGEESAKIRSSCLLGDDEDTEYGCRACHQRHHRNSPIRHRC